MRLMRTCLVALGSIALSSQADASTTRRYTDREIVCVANALYMEGGSIKATSEELRTMAHSIMVRAETDSYWARHVDWGGPDLCSVVNWKIGKKRKVCQYSFACQRKRELRRFRNPFAVLMRAVLGYQEEEYYPGAPIRVTYDELWLRCWYAAYAVFGDPIEKRWKPGGDLRLADTYQHWCSDPKYHLPSCRRALVSSARSKCWFALGNVETETQLSTPHRLHIYYRTPTDFEIEEAQTDPEKYFPEECYAMGKKADVYVKRVRNGQLARVLNPSPQFAEKKDTQRPAMPEARDVPRQETVPLPTPKPAKKRGTRRKTKYVERGTDLQLFHRMYY